MTMERLSDIRKIEPETVKPAFPAAPPPLPPRRRKRMLVIFGAALVGVLLLFVGRFSYTYQQIVNGGSLSLQSLEEDAFVPLKDADRVNLLFLGIRGIDDPEGGLLTDVMVVASIKRSTGEAALVSIPRDLWVQMPGRRAYDKINEAYALGYEEGGKSGAIEYAKVVGQRVSGLSIDGVVSVNLQMVHDAVDAIGGITLHLDRPFVEDRQWVNGGDMGTSTAFYIQSDTVSTSKGIVETQKWVFKIPAGTHTLDGVTTQYYIRARYATSDFDRARREQEVLLAVRNKLASSGVLLNPVAINKMLAAFEQNVVTDISFTRIPDLVKLVSRVDAAHVERIVLDVSEKGFLKAGRSKTGAYILLPVSGNFLDIRSACKSVFDAK
jgi:LCP family protein required for cell wall assembly